MPVVTTDLDDAAVEEASPRRASRLRWWAGAFAQEWSSTQGSLVAAGVAFYSLLALVPAIAAFAALYSLVDDDTPVRTRVVDTQVELVPEQLQDLVRQQLDSMQGASSSAIGLGAAIALIAALWSCSAALKHLLTALYAARSPERLTYVRARLLGLALTLGLLLFLVVAFAVTALAPGLVSASDAPEAVLAGAKLVGWALVGLGMFVVASVLYRTSAPADAPPTGFFTVGAAAASAVWLLGSVAFTTFIDRTAHLEASYGVLASSVGLLMWFWLFAGSLLGGVLVDVLRGRRPRTA